MTNGEAFANFSQFPDTTYYYISVDMKLKEFWATYIIIIMPNRKQNVWTTVGEKAGDH